MRFLSGNPVKAAVVITIAAASLSLTACGGNSDPSKAADKATSVATSATPTPAPDPIFTKGKVNRDDFSHDLTEGLKKMRTYHMEGSMGVAMSGEKHTMKLSSDYDGHDQSAPKAHVLVSAPDEGKDADVVILGKDVYQKSGSKWVRSSKTGVSMGQADVAKTVRERGGRHHESEGENDVLARRCQAGRRDEDVDGCRGGWRHDGHDSVEVRGARQDSQGVMKNQ